MIKSMTGFGRYELDTQDKKICVELRSVNHRYLDLNIKMPKRLNQFESPIRSELKKYIERGKVDVFITWEDHSESAGLVQYNPELAAEYLKYMRQMAEEFGIDDDVRVSTLSRCPDVLTLGDADTDEEETWKLLKQALDKASESFVEARTVEGERLKADMLDKLDGMLVNVDFITERSPQIIAEFKQSLEAKVRDLLGDSSLGESRILMEVTMYADKICVDEEIVRLKSHVKETESVLKKDGEVGRRLDFLSQEMNREANTILSKSVDVKTDNTGVSMKTVIEKIREQIQNLE